MSLLDYDGLDYHTGKFKTWVKKLLEGKSNTGHKHTKSDITDFPTSMPANGGNSDTVNGHNVNSDVPADAKFTDTDTWRPLGTTADTACAGNDSRLSNARPASDVSAWAKASSKPSYSWDEITSKPSTFTPSSHTHSYLPLSGGTVEGDLEVSVLGGSNNGGTITAQKLHVKGDTISGFSRNDMTSTTTLAINGNCYIYNAMGGHTSLKTNLTGSTATNTVYLPSTDGTLTTSVGKSATYTSSLSSGSDTLFTQAGAYAMYSELNSNLEKIKLNAKTESANSSDIFITNNYCFVENNVIHINMSIRALNNVATWSKMFRFNGYNLYGGQYITIFDYNNHQNLLGYWENGWFLVAEGLTQGNDYYITGTVSID